MKGDGAASAPVLTGPFVSYAREDQPFVRRLHEALEQRQREIWVDWEGIYPTEEWMARIRAAIDAAHSFVFVISPHSIASPVCSQEIEHAVTQGKRIIPVVAREVDPAGVHPAVAKLNWLQFREADPFDPQVEALINAMDLDVGWLRDHARLLVRAQEWQTKERDASLLLRGNDLKAAEEWLLAAGTAKDRAATALQTQFLVTSRQADTRRRNLQRLVASVALVVLSALSVYSWMQKTAAERQRNLAISRQLAARAATVTDDVSLTRLLVSALATRYSHSPEADASLANALIPTVPLARALWSPARADAIECLSFHRDGVYLAGSNTHGVAIWRVDTGQVEAFLSADDGVDCVTFGPRDNVVAVSDEGRVILWQWREGRTRTLGGDLNHETTRSAFSADGRSVVVASLGHVTRWDVERETSEVVISQAPGSYRYAFAPDATHLAAADDSQRITIWNLQTGQQLTEVQGPRGAGTVLALSAGGRTLAAGRESIAVWDIDDQGARPVNELSGAAVAVALALSHTGDRLAAVGADGAILEWDYRRRSQRPPLATVAFTASVAFAPDDATLATGSGFGAVRLWQRSSQFAHILQRQRDVDLLSEESAASGAMIALKRGRGFVFWNPGTRALVDAAEFPDRTRALQFSANGTAMVVLDADGRLGVWDVATGRRVDSIAAPPLVERIDMSDSGARIAGVDSDGGIFVASASGSATWSKGPAETGHARAIAFSPDEAWVASGGLEGDIHLWSARTGEHRLALQNGAGNVLALAFSVDGRELAANRGRDIVIWDLSTRQPRRTIRGHDSVVLTIAFSPDGTLLASGSLDKTARLWNPISGDELLRLEATANAGTVNAVAFARDGKTLATRSDARSVTLWNVDSGQWTTLACALANRNLTIEEWDRFLPSESYRAVCPDLPVPFPTDGTVGARPPVRIP